MRRMLDEKDVKDISLETIEQQNLKPVSGTVENNKWKTITIGNETHGFAGGTGGNAEWGDITGDIADQTDLKNALDAKADSADLATVATTGDYDDLLNKPDLSVYAEISTLGTAAYIDEDNLSIGYSQITNAPDLSIYAESADLATVATSGDYDDLLNKPTIPAAQVNSDWSAISGVAQILNKPTLGTAAACNTGTSSGNVPVLDSNGKLASSTIPAIAITDTFVAQDQAEMLALNADVGDVCVRTDQNKSYILRETPASNIINWQELLTPIDAVQSVNGQTGNVVLSIPDAVSGTNDGTNWTSLTIGSDTYNVGAAAPSNMVTTDTQQNITAAKYFVTDDLYAQRSGGVNVGPSGHHGRVRYSETLNTSTSIFTYLIQFDNQNFGGLRFEQTANASSPYTILTSNFTCGFDNGKCDLGKSNRRFNNLYLAGSITDGTDSIDTFETWTFTLSDNTTVTKTVFVG